MTATKTLQFTGTFADHSVLEILSELNAKGLSGGLRLSSNQLKAVVYFDHGEVIYAVSNEKQFRLFQILLDQKVIENKNLAGISEFTNDMHLVKELVEKQVLRREVLDQAISFQTYRIVSQSLSWEKGEFDFNANARLRAEMRFSIDLQKAIDSALEKVSVVDKVTRLSDLQEKFWINPNVDLLSADLNPESGFLLSRLGSDKMSAEVLASMAGMQRSDILPSLYDLWINGFILRSNANQIIDEEASKSLVDAKFVLKKKALSFEDELRKRREEEEKERKAAEREAEKLKRAQGEIPLEEYLSLVENAATHYEMFSVSPDAKDEAIKRAYLNFAKRFHPDRYQREVDKEMFERIQNAFTEIAQAYDTLKDTDTREVYDFKLKKAIEALRLEEKKESLGINSDLGENSQDRMASDNFQRGYDCLLNEDYSKALIHLARAVHIDDGNAKYHAYYGQALSFDPEKHKEAQQHLQKAVKLDSSNSKFRLMFAELLIEIGHEVRAKGELKRLLSKEPNNTQAKRLLDSLSE